MNLQDDPFATEFDVGQAKVGKHTFPQYKLSNFDHYLFMEGTHTKLYQKMGAIPCVSGARAGVKFAVWAPHAKEVSVVGDFNQWLPQQSQMDRVGDSGLWEAFVVGAKPGDRYKYYVQSSEHNFNPWRSDPFARYESGSMDHECIVWQSKFHWHDRDWIQNRQRHQSMGAPINIYELHLGSWRRKPSLSQTSQSLSYREIAEILPNYLNDMNYTHVELMPIMEHPFYGSWGYQITGFFAPTHRYGNPDDFKYLVDQLHQAGIGVILDWVPSHFPGDDFALHRFDGSPIYEYGDPRKGFHRDWNSYIFDYGRPEVRSFLISSAMFWLDEYHIDGLRVDGVASMIYLDYSRPEGEWVANQYGGRENLEAIHFLKQLNNAIHHEYPEVLTIAEESTAWPNVTRPVSAGGLGFNMKWDMGWMHDTLQYFSRDPIHRAYHQGELSFHSIYAFNENFVLSLSHDEVVYGKNSLINKMPGDEWQKFANLRALYSYMIASPGKKLLFMGGEFGQSYEWNHDASLDWHLQSESMHSNLQHCVRDLNSIYKLHRAFYETDFSSGGFQWIDCSDSQNSVYSFLRRSHDGKQNIICILNLTPIPRNNYRIGVPFEGLWQEIFNSDAVHYGGSGMGNYGGRESTPVPFHGFWHSISLTLPPLSALYLKYVAI